jgi:type II secretory pathway pseudopilin PulG
VELIVVIVILGILAAIAAPALTGYIEKARYTGVLQRGRTALEAMQVLVDEQYAMDGGLVSKTGSYSATDRFYNILTNSSNLWTFEALSPYGREEFDALVGSETLQNAPFRPSLTTDDKGHIIVFTWGYAQDGGAGGGYFLELVYIEDIDRPYIAGHRALTYFLLRGHDLQYAKDRGLTSGWSVWKRTDPWGVNDLERLY